MGDAQARLSMQGLLLQVWDTLKRTVLFITHGIDEAIFLADTVYVMSARPGRISARYTVDPARSRGVEVLTDPAFNHLCAEVLRCIRRKARVGPQQRRAG